MLKNFPYRHTLQIQSQRLTEHFLLREERQVTKGYRRVWHLLLEKSKGENRIVPSGRHKHSEGAKSYSV